MNKVKHFLIAIIFIITLYPGATFAAQSDYCDPSNLAGTKPVDGVCYSAGTTYGFGENVYIRVYARDVDGNFITGTDVRFNWNITTNLGVITPNPEITTRGYSVVKVALSVGGQVLSGSVTVYGQYGGGETALISLPINTECTANPNLLYGIAGVANTGTQNYQYSTAEVLETCYTEYKLYAPEGGRE